MNVRLDKTISKLKKACKKQFDTLESRDGTQMPQDINGVPFNEVLLLISLFEQMKVLNHVIVGNWHTNFKLTKYPPLVNRQLDFIYQYLIQLSPTTTSYENAFEEVLKKVYVAINYHKSEERFKSKFEQFPKNWSSELNTYYLDLRGGSVPNVDKEKEPKQSGHSISDLDDDSSKKNNKGKNVIRKQSSLLNTVEISNKDGHRVQNTLFIKNNPDLFRPYPQFSKNNQINFDEAFYLQQQEMLFQYLHQESQKTKVTFKTVASSIFSFMSNKKRK